MAQVVAVLTDLIFASRIMGAAKDAGIEVRIARDVAALQKVLDEGGVRRVIVDMSLPEQVATTAIRAAKASSPPPAVTAYYSHVQSNLRELARDAGADQVLPRSAFVEQLIAILMPSS
jgi:DNA-binding NarL/FixJ family response regulator